MDCDAVEPRVGGGDFDRDRIEIAEPHPAPGGLSPRRWRVRRRRSRRRGRSAAAGAATGDRKAADNRACCAVMAGAKSEAGLDLDADVVGLERDAVVRAVHDEAPGAHRRQAGERIGDPVALLGPAEFDLARRVVARRRRDEFTQQLLVRREAEIGFDQPRLAAAWPRLLRSQTPSPRVSPPARSSRRSSWRPPAPAARRRRGGEDERRCWAAGLRAFRVFR